MCDLVEFIWLMPDIASRVVTGGYSAVESGAIYSGRTSMLFKG